MEAAYVIFIHSEEYFRNVQDKLPKSANGANTIYMARRKAAQRNKVRNGYCAEAEVEIYTKVSTWRSVT